jgi:predicted MPP superfamily phosphohydrolase
MTIDVLSRREFLKLMLKSTAATLALGSGVYAYGNDVEPQLLEVTQSKPTLPHLTPAFNGYRIVQFNDIHLDYGFTPQRLSKVVTLTNQQNPDLVVLAGDFVTHRETVTTAYELIPVLSKLTPRDATVVVLGNHDYEAGADLVEEVLHQCGMIVLKNEVYTIQRGDEMLHIAGLDDIWTSHDDLNLIMEQLPAKGPAILVAHEPENADAAAATGRFELQLSGHTHGGLIWLPALGIRGILAGESHPHGRYQVGEMILYVNRGLTSVFRLNCRPEVTVFTLRTP